MNLMVLSFTRMPGVFRQMNGSIERVSAAIRAAVIVAIALTALLWAVIHVQYDLYVIAQVFVCGLVFGWLRWATGSTILTMLLHGLVNCEGMFETFMALRS